MDETVVSSKAGAGTPRASAWAVAALICSLALCPLLTVVGPLLAVRALVETRAHPERGGRGLALAALWIGIILTIGWVVVGVWWNANIRHALLHGPEDALRAGMSGDVVKFKSSFVDAGGNASDEQARAFLEATRERHGMLASAMQDHSPSAKGQTAGSSAVIPYVLTFDRGQAQAEVDVVLFAKGLMPRLRSITIKDAERGDLKYPP